MTTTPLIDLNRFHLPTQDELPCDDDVPMETQRHKTQMELLIETFEIWLESQEQGYASGNMFVYFSLEQLKNQDFRGPDFFAVVDVPKKERKSWVVWEEGKAPDVVIELLSESTTTIDKTEKKDIYQNKLRVPEYYWFDPFNIEDFAGFSLQNGIYQPMIPNETGGFISTRLGLKLAYWQGIYKTIDTTWIRWATLEGEIIPTYRERAERKADLAQQKADLAEQEANMAKQEANMAKQEANMAKQEANMAKQKEQETIVKLQQTARNLLQQGMTVTQVAQIMGITENQLQEWQLM